MKVCKEKIFLQRLKTEIKRLNLTQKQFAEKIGFSPSLISAYVNGKTVPHIGNFQKICKFLGVSADYLLGRNDK